MSAAVHHAALGLAMGALAGAGFRVASLAAPEGLERGLAAVSLATAVAIVEALALGLIGLGTNSLALVLAAVGTWAASRALVPRPELTLSAELAGWARRLPLGERLALGALGGMALTFSVWLLRYPSIGFDASIYHFAEVAAWVREGSPGSVEDVSHAFPVGNYPLSGELLLAWAAGLARSFVPLSLWAPASFLLLALSGWLGLRELGTPRALRILALAALLLSPWLVRELAEPLTDLASLSWLVTCGALCAASRRRPALLAPAIVAAGLALGTKTTALVPAAAVLIGAGVALRAHLRPLAPWLAGSAVLAFAAGGVWYLRNLIEHGSPSWPFVAAPWGDPTPPFIELLDVRFLERPLETLDGRTDLYGELLAGGIVAIGAALLAPAFAQTREVAASAGVTALAALAWGLAPVTGLTRSPLVNPSDVWALSTTRYLMPVIACAIVTLALAGRGKPAGRAFAWAALAGSTAWSFVEVTQLGFPSVPAARTLLAGATAGLLLTALATWIVPRLPPARLGAAAGAVAATAAGALLAIAAPGYLERHAGVIQSRALAGRHFTDWFATQPGFEGDGRRVTFVGRFVAAELAGARFQHELELLPADAGCALVTQRARQGWVIVSDAKVGRGVLGVGPVPATRCRPAQRPLYDDGEFRIYGVRP